MEGCTCSLLINDAQFLEGLAECSVLVKLELCADHSTMFLTCLLQLNLIVYHCYRIQFV